MSEKGENQTVKRESLLVKPRCDCVKSNGLDPRCQCRPQAECSSTNARGLAAPARPEPVDRYLFRRGRHETFQPMTLGGDCGVAVRQRAFPTKFHSRRREPEHLRHWMQQVSTPPAPSASARQVAAAARIESARQVQEQIPASAHGDSVAHNATARIEPAQQVQEQIPAAPRVSQTSAHGDRVARNATARETQRTQQHAFNEYAPQVIYPAASEHGDSAAQQVRGPVGYEQHVDTVDGCTAAMRDLSISHGDAARHWEYAPAPEGYYHPQRQLHYQHPQMQSEGPPVARVGERVGAQAHPLGPPHPGQYMPPQEYHPSEGHPLAQPHPGQYMAHPSEGHPLAQPHPGQYMPQEEYHPTEGHSLAPPHPGQYMAPQEYHPTEGHPLAPPHPGQYMPQEEYHPTEGHSLAPPHPVQYMAPQEYHPTEGHPLAPPHPGQYMPHPYEGHPLSQPHPGQYMTPEDYQPNEGHPLARQHPGQYMAPEEYQPNEGHSLAPQHPGQYMPQEMYHPEGHPLAQPHPGQYMPQEVYHPSNGAGEYIPVQGHPVPQPHPGQYSPESAGRPQEMKCPAQDSAKDLIDRSQY